MGRQISPGEAGGGFAGVDWHADRLSVGLTAFTDLVNMRVDRYGRLRACHAIGDAADERHGDTVTGIFQNPLTDAVFYARYSQAVLFLAEIGSAVGTLAPGSDLDRHFLVRMGGKLYVATGTQLAAVDLDAPGQSIVGVLAEVTGPDTLLTYATTADRTRDDPGAATGGSMAFRGIIEHGGHLFGWGWGDQAAAIGPETGALGGDRPAVLRWSRLGDPDFWRPEDWTVIGAAGSRIQVCLNAFGRIVVLKEDSAHIVYGNFESGDYGSETLQADDELKTDCVGPWAATEYDDGVYWMSTQGPLYWDGGARVQPIGYGIKEQWETGGDLSDAVVMPVPEYEAVAFLLRSGVSHRAFLWDTNRKRWAGHFDVGERVSAASPVLDTATGEYFAMMFTTTARRPQRLTGRRGALECSATTGAELVAHPIGSVPRAMILSGALDEAGSGSIRCRVPPGDAGEQVTLAAALPGAAADGALLYLQGDVGQLREGMYERFGNAWRGRAGMEAGYLYCDFDMEGRRSTRYVEGKIECNWEPDFALDLLLIEHLTSD